MEDKKEILKITGFDKKFPGVHAVRHIDLTLYEDEILGISGENGAGKSTLLKMISGVYHADEGEMYYLGKKAQFKSPKESIAAGISIIYQELSNLDNLSVAENIYLGRLPVSNRLIDWKKLNRDVKELMERYDLNISPTAKMSQLSMAEKQLVEIMKSISSNAKVIIMDEPTSSLGVDNVEKLFRIIRQVQREEKLSMVFISHRLEEMEELCDRVVVLRDGSLVAEFNRENFSVNEVVAQMVGRSMSDFYTKEEIEKGDSVFAMEHVSSKDVQDISLDVRCGEIVGIYGMAGAGQTELFETIFGLRPDWSGKMMFGGKEIHPKSPEQAIKNSICYISDDRKSSGLSMPHGINDNIVMASLSKFVRRGLVNWKKVNETAEYWKRTLPIKAPSIRTKVETLSGGNQQKVILAKWIETHPKLILFNEPTRGIDVKAKHDLFQIVQELCREGVGVLMISSDMLEMLSMSDRIYTMCEGRLTACFSRENATKEKLMKASINILEDE
ncbi:MAG: sugar ABC transporter ATP-binding protein [Eubacteriales bacterium]|nr:sugar ABC transporter ATP-binding protein [Eubacteriales bacterium]